MLTYVEARAALARMRAGARLDADGHAASVRELERYWAAVARVPVDGGLVTRAAELAERHVLRAYDAMQLAGALEIRQPDATCFACWDADLRAAAGNEGLALLP